MVEQLHLRELPAGVSIEVQVQPRCGANKVRGVHDGRLKLAIEAAPVDGEATKQCLRYLATILSVANAQVILLSGAQSRKKVILISGMTATECRNNLEPYLTDL